MTVGVALLLYVALTGTLGPRVLGRTGWTARAPLLGIVTYQAAVWSVIAALGLAGLTLAVHATALGGGLSHLIGACVLRLRATYATPGGAPVARLGLATDGRGLWRAPRSPPCATFVPPGGRPRGMRDRPARRSPRGLRWAPCCSGSTSLPPTCGLAGVRRRS